MDATDAAIGAGADANVRYLRCPIKFASWITSMPYLVEQDSVNQQIWNNRIPPNLNFRAEGGDNRHVHSRILTV